jgi:hypothetical protein
MYSRDEYANKLDRDVKREIEPCFKIPEDRIGENAVKAIAKKLGLSENTVARIHDFQWSQVNKGLDEMGLVHVSKFFKIKMMPNKVAKYVTNLEKELEELNERYEIVGKTRKKQIEERRVEIRKAIAQLNHQVGRSVQKKKAK